MSGATHPIEPYFANRIESSTDQRLSTVTLWCTNAPHSGVPHWITSFKYAERTTDFGGFSLDMFKAVRHEADPAQPHNFEGSLNVQERRPEVLVSRRPGRLQELEFVEAVTTADVLDLIQARNLQYYRFNKEYRSGCMCWQLTLLDAFVEKGWIASAELQRAREVIKAFSQEHPGVSYPPVAGTFFKAA